MQDRILKLYLHELFYSNQADLDNSNRTLKILTLANVCNKS